MGRYEEALADFTAPSSSNPAIAWAIASRGQTYRRWAATRRRWPTSTAPSSSTPAMPGRSPAGADLPRWAAMGGAGRLHPRHRARPGLCLGHRQPRPDLSGDGALRRGAGRLHRAIELNPEQMGHRQPRETYRLMGRYEEAPARGRVPMMGFGTHLPPMSRTEQIVLVGHIERALSTTLGRAVAADYDNRDVYLLRVAALRWRPSAVEYDVRARGA